VISRLGIFGGMFDPVHKGHIEAACYARDKFSLDVVKLVPCASPNHRDPASASAGQRLSMLELVVKDRADLEVDAVEINRPGISYSVDTVAQIRESMPDAQVAFVLGLDSFNTLTDWYQYERLLQLCHLLVLSRPGAGLEPRVVNAISLPDRRVQEPAALFSKDHGNIHVDEDFYSTVSSTLVRACLRSKIDVSGLLDRRVQRYIEDNGLYRQSP